MPTVYLGGARMHLLTADDRWNYQGALKSLLEPGLFTFLPAISNHKDAEALGALEQSVAKSRWQVQLRRADALVLDYVDMNIHDAMQNETLQLELGFAGQENKPIILCFRKGKIPREHKYNPTFQHRWNVENYQDAARILNTLFA